MKLGIVGSRKRNKPEDKEIVRQEILRMNPDIIITGDCPQGGDRFARELSEELEIKYKVKYKLDEHGNRVDGFISPYFRFVNICYARNFEIAKELDAQEDMLLALVAPNRQGGTENTLKHFKRLYANWENRLIIK